MDKKTEIIKALQSDGEYSQRKLDPVGRGKYAGFLLKGKFVGEGKVNEMYENLLRLQQGGDRPQVHRETIPVTEPIIEKITDMVTEITERAMGMITEQVTELQSKLQKAQEEIAGLRQKIERLKESPLPLSTRREATGEITEMVTEPVIERRLSENVLGFTLALAKGFWYASKRQGGKNYTVYVGREKAQAKIKILTKYPNMAQYPR